MANISANSSNIKPTDLRGILKYVPMFRDEVFVVAMDGSLIAHVDFENVLLDIAVLRSLHIRVVIVHGIGQQLTELADARSVPITNPHGEALTDKTTLDLAVETSALVNQSIMQGLTKIDLRCVQCNGIRAKEAGVVSGIDQQHTGVVDKIDLPLFKNLLDGGTIPVVTPIASDRNGESLRLNSDQLAAQLAEALKASKLIYLNAHDGLQLDGKPLKNISLDALNAYMESESDAIPDRLKSKLSNAAKTVHSGTPRAHILDGRQFGALLNEVFDKVGIGTMIYRNEYQSIRPARLEDAYSIFNITRNAVRSENLKARSQEMIEAHVQDYYVYEIDGSIVACIHLRYWEALAVAELGSVYVQPFYQGKGVGKQMVNFAIDCARNKGIKRVFALSTQAAPFFAEICGFSAAELNDLPEERQAEYRQAGRNSKIFHKTL